MGHAIDAGVPTFARRPDEFGVRVADLILAEAAAVVLVDEMATGQTVVDNCSVPAQ